MAQSADVSQGAVYVTAGVEQEVYVLGYGSGSWLSKIKQCGIAEET